MQHDVKRVISRLVREDVQRIDQRVGRDVRRPVATLRVHELLLEWQAHGVVLLERLQNRSKGVEVRRALDHEALAAHQSKESSEIILTIVFGAETHEHRRSRALLACVKVCGDSPDRIAERAIDRKAHKVAEHDLVLLLASSRVECQR